MTCDLDISQTGLTFEGEGHRSKFTITGEIGDCGWDGLAANASSVALTAGVRSRTQTCLCVVATQRFQQLYEAAEREASVEKRQLALLHQQRVQAEMDDRKRRLLQKYVEAVDTSDDQRPVDVSALTVPLTACQRGTVAVPSWGRGQRPPPPKSWLGPQFSRTLDTLWSIDSQKN